MSAGASAVTHKLDLLLPTRIKNENIHAQHYDIVGKCFNFLGNEVLITTQYVSRTWHDYSNRFLKMKIKSTYMLSNQNFDNIFSMLSPREKACLLSYATERRYLNQLSQPTSTGDNFVISMLISAGTNEWANLTVNFTEAQKAGLMVGLNPKTLSENATMRMDHVRAAFFQGIPLEQSIGLTPKQLDAVRKRVVVNNVNNPLSFADDLATMLAMVSGLSDQQVFALMSTKYSAVPLNKNDVISLNDAQVNAMLKTRGISSNPKEEPWKKPLQRTDVVDLRDIQIDALLWEEGRLTREQVNHQWFAAIHLIALKEGLKYEDIAGLLDFQIDGIRLKLTREQVTQAWFDRGHVTAIKEGFQYAWIKGISDQIYVKSYNEVGFLIRASLKHMEKINVECGDSINCYICGSDDHKRYLKSSDSVRVLDSNALPNQSSGLVHMRIIETRSLLSNLLLTKAEAYDQNPSVFIRGAQHAFLGFTQYPGNHYFLWEQIGNYHLPSDLDRFKEKWKNRLALLNALEGIKKQEISDAAKQENSKDTKDVKDNKDMKTMAEVANRSGTTTDGTALVGADSKSALDGNKEKLDPGAASVVARPAAGTLGAAGVPIVTAYAAQTTQPRSNLLPLPPTGIDLNRPVFW